MTTVSTAINRACRQLGFTPNAAEAADALDALNLMLADWATSPGGLYKTTRENFTTVASTKEYAIGTGQTWNSAVPIRIMQAFTRTDNVDYPIEVYYSLNEYANIPLKSTTSRPDRLFFERTSATVGTLLFYMTPDAAYDVHIWSHKALAEYASISDTLALPFEYEPAIKWNLAVDLAAEFGIDIKTQTAVRAEESLMALKRMHAHPMPKINTDPFGHSAGYDIDSDTMI
jgi:hypothetical protein